MNYKFYNLHLKKTNDKQSYNQIELKFFHRLLKGKEY